MTKYTKFEAIFNFYPRPPRGGRRPEPDPDHGCQAISIHALREEGDKFTLTPKTIYSKFLSTPSARRATSCTDTYECFKRNFYPRPP